MDLDLFQLGEFPKVNETDFNIVKSIYQNIQKAKNTTSNFERANFRLEECLFRTTYIDILIDSIIGLESLLSKGFGELSYKLAIRVAGLLKLRVDYADNPIQVFSRYS